MKKYINQILDTSKCEKLLLEKMDEIFKDGAINTSNLEIISMIKIHQPQLFERYENQILIKMGLFFKPLQIESFEDNVFKIYWDYIKENYNGNFTPTQADIIDNIENNKVFSFSSPTSTGKSFIFRYLLQHFKRDIVIIVPSRALINEYYKRITETYKDKETNILTFVDIINTKRAKKNIFIITPERTRDLFLYKDVLKVDLILFDEAQLSDENNIRGMYYDSVVRRAVKHFPEARYVFAYPFISNPDVQFSKNNITFEDKKAIPYTYMNVGQVFYSYDENNNFYSFGTDVTTTGQKVRVDFDPLAKVLKSGGTALIYCAKAQIYDRRIMRKFAKYLQYCDRVTNLDALDIIERIRSYIGASDKNYGNYASLMIRWMKHGIVFHHGSLPLKVRILIEEFTQKEYSKICFATATLEQGINMPFDLVWIEKFEPSRPLDVKNLVGRAGRSTSESTFDFGQVVIKDGSRTKLSKIIRNGVPLKEISQLDETTDPNDDYREYKEAIKNGTFSEEYNLTETELNRIEATTFSEVESILNLLYVNDQIDYGKLGTDEAAKTEIISSFINIYKKYLGRDLVPAEEYVLTTTVKILFWRVRGKKFNQIVSYRYAYAAQTKLRSETEKQILENTDHSQRNMLKEILENLEAKRLTMFQMIPDRKLRPLDINYDESSHKRIKAVDVDFDRIVVDTYDFIDKLIGFRLGDVYFATFDKYYKDESRNRNLRLKARAMTNYIKYGTDVEKEIWLLRYGFEFEDMDWLLSIVESVNQEEIIFSDVTSLTDEQFNRISKFID